MTKQVLITGATDGLGLALAHRRVDAGDRVILHGRDRVRAESLASELAARSREPVDVVIGDYSDLAEVRTLADQVGALTDRLDVLVNNAGVGSGEPTGRDRRVTRDGFELRFGVNHLSTLRLTLDLLPLLRRSAPARVVTVASAGQSPIDLDDLQSEKGEYSSMRAYTASKLAEIMAVRWLASREDPAAVTLNSVHPSTRMPTKIVIANGTPVVGSIDEGVASVERLIDDPRLAAKSGLYFDRLVEAAPDPQVEDASVVDALMAASLRMVRLDD